eukprot:XP_011661706.1 PREDICTED: deleted in malignant brain tumors 1 protein-like isoform X1 [Strongylocentrotus purpuratus]
MNRLPLLLPILVLLMEIRSPVVHGVSVDITTEASTILSTDIQYSTNGADSLAVRLINGSSSNASGRVEVWYNSTWGTVCDDGWDLNDAHVVCRMLGFFNASSAPVSAAYGAGSGKIHLDEVECTGSESSLEDCIKNKFEDNDCNHSEDAGVTCGDSPAFQPHIWIPKARIGDQLKVRLNGSSNATGRVEVLYNDTWGTVCDDGWDLNDAHVVCRMLGFTKASSAPVMAACGAGSGKIFLDEVECTGSEERLGDCITSRFGEHDCTHSEDAGVTCEATVTGHSEPDDSDTWTSGDIGRPTSRPEVWSPSTTNTGSQLEVHLVNEPNNAEGTVEVRYNASSAWGTVCDDGWDLNDAHVVCRMLGFFKASSAPVMAFFGAGSGEIHLDEVDCTGSESSLENCIKSEFGVSNCDHSEDAGVICTEHIDLEVRLTDGPNNNSGRVEVFEEGSWGTICDDGWDGRDANVVCKWLGFFGAAYAPVQATYGEGVGDISLRNVDCIGTESNLGKCFHDRPERFDCAHDEDAGAVCLVLIPDDSVSWASSWNGK